MARARLSLLCALAIALSSAGVRAQDEPAAAPQSDARSEAELRFFAGRALYDAGRFADALVEFRGSHGLSPSPNSRLYVARCLRETGDLGGAYEEYAQVIQDSTSAADPAKYAGTQSAATDERTALRDKLAFVILVAPSGAPGAEVTLASKRVEAARLGAEVPVPAGHVSVRAEAEGRTPFVASLELAPGETRRVVIDLPAVSAPPAADPPPKRRAGLRPLVYASSGVAVVGITTWAILGLAAKARFDDLSRRCSGRCTPGFQGEIDGGRAESAVSTAGLVLGLAGLAGGAASWWFVSREEASPRQVTARITPSLGGLFVSGTFR